MMNDLEKLETVFNDIGIRYRLEEPGTRDLTANISGTSIIVDQGCFRIDDGEDVFAKWDAYVCFFFYFDFDENGKFEKCGAFE